MPALYLGAGLLQTLCLRWLPLPHLTSQSVQGAQLDQPPSTKMSSLAGGLTRLLIMLSATQVKLPTSSGLTWYKDS